MSLSPDLRAQARTLGIVAALIVLTVGAQGLVDYIDRTEDARIAHRQWIADACMPGEGQTTVARRIRGKIECTVYARYEKGMAREVVSAAVAVVP